MPTPTSAVEAKLELLAACPSLAGLARRELMPLARAARFAAYPDACPLWAPGSERDAPLRIVATGRAAVQIVNAGCEDRRLLGPGELFGTEAIAAWAGAASVRAASARFLAHVADPCTVLELDPADVERVFGDPDAPGPLLRAVLDAYRRAVWWPELYAALSRTEAFSGVRRCQAWSLLSRGRVVRPMYGDLLQVAGERPDRAWILLDGCVRRIGGAAVAGSPDGEWVSGSVFGLAELLGEAPAVFGARVGSPATLLELPRDALVDGLRSIPGLVQRLVCNVGRAPLLATSAIPPCTTTCFTRSGGAYDGAMPDWIARAGDALERYGDRVVRVRLVDGRTARAGTLPVARLTPRWLAREVGDQPTQVLLDATEVRDRTALDAALAGLGVAVRPALIVRSPSAWQGALAAVPLSRRRWALPIAVLPAHATRSPSNDALWVRALRKAAGRIATATRDEVRSLVEELRAPPEGGLIPHWPVGTVRMQLAGGSRDRGAIREASAERLARAVSYRRVGVAIGGAGALTNAAIAVIQAMDARGVPIDAVSGTSYGTLVGAFYTALGPESFDRLLRWAPTLLPMLLWTGPFTSRGLSSWMRLFVGDTSLDALPIPLLPVGTDAREFTEVDVRGGEVAEGVRVSGSMPPGAPTIRAGMRLLDGGLVADVPCRVLDDEGCDLIVGLSSFPVPGRIPGPLIWIPFLSACVANANPIARSLDTLRGQEMLWHFAGYGQRDYATVTWNATTRGATSFSFWASRWIVEQAARSDALRSAMENIERAWLALVPNQRWLGGATAPLGAASIGFFDGAPDARSRRLLDELGAWLAEHDQTELDVEVAVGSLGADAANLARARLHGDALRAHLAARGVDPTRVRVRHRSADRTSPDAASARGVR